MASCPTLRLVFQPVKNVRRHECAESTGDVVGATAAAQCNVSSARAPQLGRVFFSRRTTVVVTRRRREGGRQSKSRGAKHIVRRFC